MSERVDQILEMSIAMVTGPLAWVLIPLIMVTVFSYFFAKGVSLKIGLTSFIMALISLQIPSSGFYNNIVVFSLFCVIGFAMFAKWNTEKSVKPVERMR